MDRSEKIKKFVSLGIQSELESYHRMEGFS